MTKAQKEVTKQEKAVKRREKDLEEARPELVTIEAGIAHAGKKLKVAEKNTAETQADLATRQAELARLKADLAAVEKAEKRHRGESPSVSESYTVTDFMVICLTDELKKTAASKGLALSAEDLKEYQELFVLFSSDVLFIPEC